MNSSGQVYTADSLVEEVQIKNPRGITNQLDFSLKPSAQPCRTLRSVVSAANKSTATHGDPTAIYLPPRKQTYLVQDASYLTFDVKGYSDTGFGTAKAFVCDHSFYTMIGAVNIYHGNSLLESIQNYGALVTALLDCSLTPSSVISKNIHMGMNGTPFVASGTADTATVINTTRKGLSVTTAGAKAILPLVGSSILGPNAERYFPLDTADQLRIEITWNNASQSTASSSTYLQFTNISLTCKFLELGNVAQSLVDKGSPNYLLHASAWRNFVATTQKVSGQQSFSIGASFSSMKMLMIAPLPEYTQDLAYSQSSRIVPWSSYYVNLAGQPFPATAIKSTTEAYAELQNAWNCLDTIEGDGLFDATGYAQSNIATFNAATGYRNNYLACIGFDSFDKKSGIVSSGIDTVGSSASCQFVADIDGTLDPVQLQMFVNYDVIYIVSRDGSISVKF